MGTSSGKPEEATEPNAQTVYVTEKKRSPFRKRAAPISKSQPMPRLKTKILRVCNFLVNASTRKRCSYCNGKKTIGSKHRRNKSVNKYPWSKRLKFDPKIRRLSDGSQRMHLANITDAFVYADGVNASRYFHHVKDYPEKKTEKDILCITCNGTGFEEVSLDYYKARL